MKPKPNILEILRDLNFSEYEAKAYVTYWKALHFRDTPFH